MKRRRELAVKVLKRFKAKKTSTREKVGMPPGTLTYTGKKKTDKFSLNVISYTQESYEEKNLRDHHEALDQVEKPGFHWINVVGLNHVKEVESIGLAFGMHKLLLEDVLNTGHRPKVEDYDKHIFLTLKMLNIEEVDGVEEITEEQVSFVLGKNWLISFQEEEGDVFDILRKRMKMEGSQIRSSKMDYLFYRLIDTIVDHYFIVSEHISDAVESIEEQLISELDEGIRWRMQTLRKDLIQLRKTVVPLREAVGHLSKEQSEFISESTTRYMHDVYEHIIQLNDYIDTQRDMISSLGDLYLSGISHKMNQIMKVLTIIATIFIPLTFIAGIYGMNFANIPELNWEYGYAGVWILMIIVTGFMLYYFKKKDWL